MKALANLSLSEMVLYAKCLAHLMYFGLLSVLIILPLTIVPFSINGNPQLVVPGKSELASSNVSSLRDLAGMTFRTDSSHIETASSMAFKAASLNGC